MQTRKSWTNAGTFLSILAFAAACAFLGGAFAPAASRAIAQPPETAPEVPAESSVEPEAKSDAEAEPNTPLEAEPESDAEPEADTTAEPDATEDAELEPSTSEDDGSPLYKVVAAEKPTSTMGKVDSAFGTAVEYMAAVLFYKVPVVTSKKVVQFNYNLYYVRDPKSKGDFKLLNPNDEQDEKTLSDEEVSLRDALDELAHDGIQKGKVLDVDQEDKEDGRAVEFVVVPVNNGKYVLSDGKYSLQNNKQALTSGTFSKLTPKRQLVSDKATDVLNLGQIENAYRKGRLKLNHYKVEAELPDSFILEEKQGPPLVVAWLAVGAVFFTIYMSGYNFWGFRHAVDIVRGTYDNPNETGEVTHFQALSSALSATVGLGNIAGVTIAMTTGGPGAFFWMLACGFFGMTSKFVECTLGQKYRTVNKDGTVLGGPMQYLHVGLKGLGLGPLGQVLAIVFAIMCILASFGGGNMFQANQSGQQVLTLVQLQDSQQLEKLSEQIEDAAEKDDVETMVALQRKRKALVKDMAEFKAYFLPGFGVALALLVGAVILGGIKRIGATAAKIVPTMCGVYVLACLWIIGSHAAEVPALIVQIFTEAFTPQAFGGGFVGVLVIGVQRAAFSNEAGVGSASIAHSAAKTEEPVREGTVALMGPFIDTIVVCSMTAMVILITGAWDNTAWVV
ncbi:MAG: alanine:cation symporter family protein, partial [Planctomycetales bacterium]